MSGWLLSSEASLFRDYRTDLFNVKPLWLITIIFLIVPADDRDRYFVALSRPDVPFPDTRERAPLQACTPRGTPPLRCGFRESLFGGVRMSPARKSRMQGFDNSARVFGNDR